MYWFSSTLKGEVCCEPFRGHGFMELVREHSFGEGKVQVFVRATHSFRGVTLKKGRKLNLHLPKELVSILIYSNMLHLITKKPY